MHRDDWKTLSGEAVGWMDERNAVKRAWHVFCSPAIFSRLNSNEIKTHQKRKEKKKKKTHKQITGLSILHFTLNIQTGVDNYESLIYLKLLLYSRAMNPPLT